MKLSRTVLAIALSTLILGCATTPKKNITELYEPMYQSAFDYTPKQTDSSSAGFNVGIMNMQFDFEAVPPGSYVIDSGLNQQYTKNFQKAVAAGLETILISKGISVSGPFGSYEEMTYPERSRCDFLVQPTVKIVLQGKTYNQQQLPDYAGPQGQGFTYLKADYDLTATAEMEYVVYDPLTKEKLERHKLSTDPVKKSTIVLAVKYVNKDQKGNVIKESWVPLWKDPDHPNSHNSEIIYGKILTDLYGYYLSKVDGLISVDEFNHLNKFKQELKDKKRY